jgi:Cupredoxin-like domain
MLRRATWAHVDADGHQVVDVTVHGGYHPDRIVARAGRPLRLVFRRVEDDACSERVVFSSPRLDRRLAAIATTTIDLPAQPAGHVRFTCGMGRYRGRIDLVEGRSLSAVGPVRALITRFGAPGPLVLGASLAMLPLAALAALFLLDGPVAVLVAAAAVVAWLSGCAWAAARLTRKS